MSGPSTATVPPDSPLDSGGINAELFVDSALSSSRIEIGTPVEEALYLCLDMREPITGSAKQAHQRYARAATKSRRVFSVLEEICAELEHRLTNPHFAAVSPGGNFSNRWKMMEASARRWCRELAEQLKSDRIGRVTPLGENAVRFDFFEVATKRGIWRHAKTRTRLVHELVQARLFKLPAEHVDKPAKAQRIVRRIEQIPELARQCRILAGLQVSKASADQDQWHEDSRLAMGVKAAGRAVANNSKALASGAAVLGAGALAAAAEFAAAPMAAADPAICLGDVVFYGWD